MGNVEMHQLLVVLLLLVLFSVSSAAPPTCSLPVDIGFIIDSSGNISTKNYLKEKIFVKEVAKSFGLAPDHSQAAMVLFSTSASVQARFGQYATTEEFAKAVDALPHERGLTRIDRALDLAATDIFPEARMGVLKLALLITGGSQTLAADAKGLREASRRLRKAGVRVLAVGIGSGVDRDELRLIAKTENNVVVVPYFRHLPLTIGNLTNRACKLAAPPTCSLPVDIAFIIDSSDSISRSNYLKQKNFVKEVAKSFGLAPDHSRAAMVLFSNSPSVEARFGQYATTEEFAKAVDALPHKRSMTRIDRALDLAATDILPEARVGVSKIVLLITDGSQTAAADAKDLREASEPLRKASVRVLAVGIGSGVDRDELRLVAETEVNVVVVPNFQHLLLKIGNLTSRACKLAAPPPCSLPVDVAFIIDSSGSIGRSNYLKQKNFVKEVAKSFGLAPDHSQAAIVLFSNSSSVEARFGQYATTEKFAKAVDALPHERGLTRIDRALDLAATDIFSEARVCVPKLALLITGGKPSTTADTRGLRETSQHLQKASIHVLAVGISSRVNRDELRLITETDSNVLLATNFRDLWLTIVNLTSKACKLAGECGQS